MVWRDGGGWRRDVRVFVQVDERGDVCQTACKCGYVHVSMRLRTSSVS